MFAIGRLQRTTCRRSRPAPRGLRDDGHRPRWRAASLGLALVPLLAACGGPLETAAGPSASDPACAGLLEALPDRIDNLGRRTVTGAGTAAWGDPPVVLFCGVEEIGPTTDPCLSVGTSHVLVDWVQLPDDARGSAQFVTYGRSPAVQVVVPSDVAKDQPSAVLVDLASAIAALPAHARCT